MTIEQATFGGGCFWATEAVFQQLRGVKTTVPGYAGGLIDNPSYEQVAEGTSGHAEVVRVHFDSDRISYADLLEVFFEIHDATTLNRQGSDVGHQYRSVIFFHDAAQEAVARKIMRNTVRTLGQEIVTELVPASNFYAAEEFHHNYYKHNGHQLYCSAVVAPKVKKARDHMMSKGNPRQHSFVKRDVPYLVFSSMA